MKRYSQERSCSLQVCHVSLIQLGQLALFHRHYVSKQKCVCFVVHCLNPYLVTFDLVLSLYQYQVYVRCNGIQLVQDVIIITVLPQYTDSYLHCLQASDNAISSVHNLVVS